MSDADLKNLFNRFAAPRGAIRLPEVEDLLAQTRASDAARIASPVHADLLRFSRDLEPLSAQLGSDLAAAFDAGVAPHRRSMPNRRAASARRGWRIAASAMAACLVVAVALIATHRSNVPASATANAMHLVPDRIFAGFDERNVAASKPAHGDQIFRGNFVPDEIFNSSKSNDG